MCVCDVGTIPAFLASVRAGHLLRRCRQSQPLSLAAYTAMTEPSDDINAGQLVFGCECIQQSGILLRLPQVAVSTAQVMFHRFYAKRSMRKFDVRVRA